MIRKVIKQGHNTLTLTLPKKWCDTHHIDSGSEIDVKENNRDLIIAPQAKSDAPLRIELNIVGMKKRTVRWIVSILHKLGYDEIYLTYDKDFDATLLHELVKELLMGFAIMEQTPTHCLLKSISKDREEEYENTYRRAFYVTISLAESCLGALEEEHYAQLASIAQLEKTNNQLTNFCERIINKGLYAERDMASFSYVLAWNLEKICDDYKYICTYFAEETKKKQKIILSKKVLKVFADSITYLKEFLKIYNHFNLNHLNSVVESKNKLIKELHEIIQKDSEQGQILASYLLSSVFKITDLAPSTLAIKRPFERS